MQGATASESRVQEISHISRSLKLLARDLDVPVMALSQLSRAVESRQDKRPILSDLRESGCLTGETQVLLPETGTYARIDELVGRDSFGVMAVATDSWRIGPATATRSFSTGTKPVFKMRTHFGREIRATANHRFLTIDGWRRLDKLSVGDHLAVPRALPAGGGESMPTERLGRDRAARVADIVRSEPLGALAQSDVYWDPISSIEPDGAEPVYDITVEGPHNFVANDMIVHNSIEQDADVVMFIYRDEYYVKDSETNKGIAELIVAKHRSGATDSVELAFRQKYTLFSDLARGEA
jgi:replicative DNA helicase